MRNLSVIIIILVFIVDCSVSSRFIRELDRESAVIVVLPFTGNSVSQNYLNLARNELTRLIFIRKGFSVIDNNQVNYYLRILESDYSGYPSKKQYVLLADSLQANIFIAGSIEKFFLPSEHEENLQHYILTLCFINGENAKILGMVTEKLTTTLPLSQIIPELFEKMILKI